LVEDSVDNQQLIWRYLTKYGAIVDIADNGDEGVKKALASEHDVVLMDLQMPVLDGYAATGKLRSRGYRVPIIALTAHAMADVRKKCQDVGCTDHLPKPINSRDLVEAVKNYGGRH
jgi:CheY-like chemotaxis protein